MIHADRAVPGVGGPFGDRAAVAIVGESLGDVAREALKIARSESQSRPVLLVDLLGQGSALDEMFGNEDPHGVSDAARYGVSLGTLARQVPNADSLFVVSGGAESPQAEDVLSDHLWSSWSDQCRRSGALLVVAAPADLPAVGKAIDQLDGLVMIGDAPVPDTHAPVIGRLRTPRRSATVDAPPRPVAVAGQSATARPVVVAEQEAVPEVTPRPELRIVRWALGTVAVVGLLAGAWWANGQLQARRTGATERSGTVGQPIVMPGDPIEVPAAGGAADVPAGAVPWTVELASVNTLNGAMARVRQALDSMPVLTFAATQPGGGAIWYRLRAGAYSTSKGADSLLSALRARGAIEPAAGRVVQASLAWLLEENIVDEQLPVRLFLWRRQGLPAYALLNTQNGTSRIYFGAFENETEARLLTPMLDSLNLYATLATRIGSVR
jgi:hypothetical protein